MPTPAIIEYAMYGELKKVEECITNGDDINVTDSDYGWTALMKAASSSGYVINCPSSRYQYD